MEQVFYLQDSRSHVGHNLVWWAKGGNGYTTNLENAEIYPRDLVVRMHRSRISDVPWSKEYVAGKSFLAVDHQCVRKSECRPMAECSDGQLFYIQDKGDFAGNDMLWHTESARTTNNLTQAKAFTKAEALAKIERNSDNVAWPKDYIETKTRPVADCRDAKLDEAIAGTGIEILKPKKERRESYRCHGCGVFMSASQYYGGECRCGADNRP